MHKTLSLVALGLLLALVGSSSLPAEEIAIEIDGRSAGRVFEGIGALSAGASSRLLLDYPESYRSDILDFLFRPKFGASLHHLKVEIGGDVNSTDGSEPSHAANRDEFERPKPEYFRRGYQWWLMEEARKRNPHIILEALQWGAPGWIGNGNFASEDNARFIAAFHQGAKQYHNLDIEYQGIWNEKRCDADWIKVLRKTLDECGLKNVKIVADDQWEPEQQWRIAERMVKDRELCAAVHALNAHVAELVNFQVPKFASSLNKPLWNGEMHAYGGDWYAAAGHARFNNRAYIQGRITSTVSWSLISSYHEYLTCPKSGMMQANTPWSGRYEVQPPLWMIAHTNQFAEPGWKYLDGACRFFASEACLREGWSIVALRSPDSGDYSIVIETMDAKVPQNVRFRISKDLSQGDLAVWRSVFQGDLLARQADIPLRDGQFTMTLVPNAIYSLTTTRGQRKGEPAHALPAAKPFPLPFTADFEDQVVGGPGRYFSDQHGTFEVAHRSDGKGKCLHQTVTRQGIQWVKYPNPRTIVGDPQWKDYALAVDVMLPHGGKAMVWGRVDRLDNVWDAASVPFSGYGLEIADDGSWSLGIEKRVLASGKTAPLGTDWHTVTISFAGQTVTAGINGRQLAEVKDSTRPGGLAGLGSGWNEACFDNLRVSTLLPPNFGDTSGWGRNLQRTMRLLATSTPQKRNTVRILFYGQSITEQRWCQAVADDLRARFPCANLVIENRALGGFASQMLVKTSEADLYPFYPDLLIFRDQGAHDKYEDIIRRVRERTVAEVLLQNDHVTNVAAYTEETDPAKLWPPKKQYWEAFWNHNWLPGLAKRYAVEYCDQRKQWKRYLQENALQPAQLLVDGGHLNVHGEFLMAAITNAYLRYDPRLGPAAMDNCVRTCAVGRDAVWREGKLRLAFEGNRVDLIVKPGAAPPAAVRIDGRRPSEFPELYGFTRTQAQPGGKFPPLAPLKFQQRPLVEDWTMEVVKEPRDAEKFRFVLRGSKTGPDGEGRSDQRFVSRSGRIVIEPDAWNVTFALWLGRVSPVPDRFTVTWSVVPHFADEFVSPGAKDATVESTVTLAQGLGGGKHVLEITGGEETPIAAVRVFCPPGMAGLESREPNP